jgi:hypothetical protein
MSETIDPLEQRAAPHERSDPARATERKRSAGGAPKSLLLEEPGAYARFNPAASLERI